jgi:hypothetical protein
VIVYFNHQSIPLLIIKAAGKTRIVDGTPTSIEDGKEDERDEYQNSEEDSEDEDDRILAAVSQLAQFSFLQVQAGQGESSSYPACSYLPWSLSTNARSFMLVSVSGCSFPSAVSLSLSTC